MAEIIFTKSFDEKFFNNLPEHRKMINRLITEGTILGYSLSSSRNKLWIVFSETNKQKIKDLIYKSPISAYFLKVTLTPLLLHEGIPADIPHVWLN